ncbi:protein of unknown function DUF4094 [Cynara cardunculus var. scolymus]|uniref:Hexosyltransferase n=1 Tax=Cynara cardunculus var. scolymus TaxID=59895 RepID=A0A124SBU6_CYNCS|nr:protein of unknown function DUF4094 [Cynara cardunculus var. scolymus]
MGLMYGTKQSHKLSSGAGAGVSTRWVTFFCIVSFCFGVIFINRFGSPIRIKRDEVSSPLEKQQELLQPDASVDVGDIFSQVSRTHDVIMTLDKTISSLETQLASARSAKKPVSEELNERQNATPDGLLDHAINVEDRQHEDFLRLDHVEGYHELSSKTQIYFSTAAARWDADFYIKVDDDVHINLG